MEPVIVAGVEDASTFISLTATQWLWLGSLLLYASGLVLIFAGKRRTEDEEEHLFVHVVVCFIAGTLYAAMATGIADVTLMTAATTTSAATSTGPSPRRCCSTASASPPCTARSAARA